MVREVLKRHSQAAAANNNDSERNALERDKCHGILGPAALRRIIVITNGRSGCRNRGGGGGGALD